MTVEDRRSGSHGEDRFPIGMRVLAVDDDPTCLLILETLLKRCQYQVTTTNQAIMALKMLRENRNKFDLVISDVNMPDMDGFKLLELVGLEMDLPVIMLSAHSDTKLVMKGITHGACDYLLKPVRIEELQNIWQHVVRRKKFEPKDHNREPNQDFQPAVVEAGSGATSAGSGDQNRKTNRKRKDQSEDDEEEGEDNERENEDPSTQKKPRVVWSVELHRNFVTAVNQLGLDKAVPKKILDLMNVEGITRENVASHLQKYRLYLKRIAAQQANMVAALGTKDVSYLRMGSLDGFGDFRTLNGPGRFSSTSLSSSYPPGGMLGRLNSSAALSLRGINTGINSQTLNNTSQTLSNTIHTLGKIQPSVVPASQNQGVNLLRRIPTSLDVNQQSHNKSATSIGKFNSVNDPIVLGIAGSNPDSRVMHSVSSSVPTASSGSFLLQTNTEAAQSNIAFGNQSSLGPTSLHQESFDMGVHVASNFLDSRCDENWQGATIPKFPVGSIRMNGAFGHEDIPSNNLQDDISWAGSQVGNSAVDLSSSMVNSAPLEDGRRNLQYHADLSSNLMESMKHWQELGHNYNQNVNNSFRAGSLVSEGDLRDQNNAAGTNKTDVSLLSHLNGDSPFVVRQTQGEKSMLDTKLSSNLGYSLEQPKLQNGSQSNYGSLDDIMSTIIKPGQNNETGLMDGEFGFDAYSLGSCI